MNYAPFDWPPCACNLKNLMNREATFKGGFSVMAARHRYNRLFADGARYRILLSIIIALVRNRGVNGYNRQGQD
jgi:hypothetical protein